MVTKRLKVYLDTSVLNFAISTQDVPREREATLKLFKEIKAGKFAAYVSDVTVDEILRAGERKRNELLKVLSEINAEQLPVYRHSGYS